MSPSKRSVAISTAEYDPLPLARLLEAMLKERNESYREASLRAGLDHGTLRRYITKGQRPSSPALLALADHFGLNPNDLLTMAGYRPLDTFERLAEEAQQSLPADLRPLIEDLGRVADPALRRRLIEAVRVLIAGHLHSP